MRDREIKKIEEGKSLFQTVAVEISLDLAVVRDGDCAGLLRDDDRDRIRFFRHTDRGAMPRS